MAEPEKQPQKMLENQLVDAAELLKEHNYPALLATLRQIGLILLNSKDSDLSREGIAQTIAELPAPPQFGFEQHYAFTVLKNAWDDKYYASYLEDRKVKKTLIVKGKGINELKGLRFLSDNQNSEDYPQSCLAKWDKTHERWDLISTAYFTLDSANTDNITIIEKLIPHHELNDDVKELLQKFPHDFAGKGCYSEDDKKLIARLKRALKRNALPHVDQTLLKPKAKLDSQTQDNIQVGLRALRAYLDRSPGLVAPAIFEHVPAKTTNLEKHHDEELPEQNLVAHSLTKKSAPNDEPLSVTPLKNTSKQDISSTEITSMELIIKARSECLILKARSAIKSYQTPSQKFSTLVGKIIAAITAFTFGFVELGAAPLGLYFAAGIAWSSPIGVLLGIILLALAAIIPWPTTWVNWKIFSSYLPNFFHTLKQEFNEITSPRKKVLFGFMVILATTTGIAIGGLAYTSAIALPALLGLSTIAFIFPPLGAILAAAVAIAMACMLLSSFLEILQRENSWKAIMQPFSQVAEMLGQNEASFTRRAATWLLVFGLASLSILGLALSCFTCTRSVGKMFIDQFKTAPQKALVIGILIGGISGFFSRVYFTLRSATQAALTICRRLLNKSAHFRPFSGKKILAIMTDAVTSGMFFAQSLLSLTQQSPAADVNDVNPTKALPPTVNKMLIPTAAITITVRHVAQALAHVDDSCSSPENTGGSNQQSPIDHPESLNDLSKKEQSCIKQAAKESSNSDTAADGDKKSVNKQIEAALAFCHNPQSWFKHDRAAGDCSQSHHPIPPPAYANLYKSSKLATTQPHDQGESSINEPVEAPPAYSSP